MEYESIIGLEVHAQLNTQTKIFCGCSTQFGATPNSHTCPVCLGMPGMLPVLNKKVVDYALMMSLATHCTINRENRFARKNYFYPDLPKGYQISQFELPIAEHGYIMIDNGTEKKRIGITRIHMEEDAGKLLHDPHRSISRVDYNRTGVPLIEIVSEPDIRTPEQAGAYLRKLHGIVCYTKICDGNMEEGSFRCDANVSIRPKGQKEFGTRTELKNLNSFKNVEKAIQYEIERQKALIEDGGQVIQETRLFDADRGKTYSMRGKEEAHDYRYFPDPDLLPVVIDQPWIDAIKESLPELPEPKKIRFISDYQLPEYDADILTTNREIADYFESCAKEFQHFKEISNWIMGPLLGYLNTNNLSIDASPIQPSSLAQLLKLIQDNVINRTIAKTVFDTMAETGKPPKQIVEEKGLMQVSDTDQLKQMIEKIIEDNPKEVDAYRNGKNKLFSFFMGQAMKQTRGKANPKIVTDILNDCLSKS